MRVIPNPNPPLPRESEPSPYCGRIDEHEAHDHHTHNLGRRRTLRCPGAPLIEGGARS